ncbi:unnamed protein product [Adineta steineri]|uniref:YHYH domain-containing protein n=1 Tax=Adineta steineri TaxID=433720 RepID=A0A815TJE4_9BILA|nr:unnamed protein product [Adineta steineri]CAF4079841.1 unnamed protein product [Adineta steineri]
MFTSIVILLILFGVQSIDCTASNSLSDCNTVAASFYSTCGGVAVSSIISSTGTNVSCSSGFTSSTCPGTMYGSTCVFQHKLCVTCSGSSPVRIRVQSNGLPRFCPNVPASVSELNIDFTVNFNSDVDVNSPIQTATSSSALSSIVCNINSQQTVPSAYNYVVSGSTQLMAVIAGISVDGVSILNVNSANNVDPFFPAGGYSAETVDSCMGHPNPSSNSYHYHIASGCALTPPSGTIATCSSTSSCNSNIATYSISTFSSYRTKTVIGIAKDGHIIYGPYTTGGVQVTSGFDICNGMFHDSIGNYGYFATQTYPYITGCFGPGNYPTATVNCSTNAPSSYSKSIYALNFSTSANTTTTTTITTTVASGNTTTHASNITTTHAANTTTTHASNTTTAHISSNARSDSRKLSLDFMMCVFMIAILFCKRMIF